MPRTQACRVKAAGQTYSSSPVDSSSSVVHRASQAACCRLLKLVKAQTELKALDRLPGCLSKGRNKLLLSPRDLLQYNKAPALRGL